jgi:hypothetical protein
MKRAHATLIVIAMVSVLAKTRPVKVLQDLLQHLWLLDHLLPKLGAHTPTTDLTKALMAIDAAMTVNALAREVAALGVGASEI